MALLEAALNSRSIQVNFFRPHAGTGLNGIAAGTVDSRMHLRAERVHLQHSAANGNRQLAGLTGQMGLLRGGTRRGETGKASRELRGSGAFPATPRRKMCRDKSQSRGSDVPQEGSDATDGGTGMNEVKAAMPLKGVDRRSGVEIVCCEATQEPVFLSIFA